MTAETKVARYGNSLTVRLPVAMAREFDLRNGDNVTLRSVNEGVLIERPRRSRLAARLATVREREAEIGTGLGAGRENFE
jgi:antitoxin component of MazEF toxin-antitoxin module